MSSLVINSVVPATPPIAEAPVLNDGFFPDIDPAGLRKELRIRDSVTPERLRRAILGAIITVGQDLDVWALAHRLAGYATLSAVPSPALDGRTRLMIQYARAIGSTVKAELVESYRDTDLTGAGQRQVDDMDPSIGELRRDATHAIRDMLGRGRTCVELI